MSTCLFCSGPYKSRCYCQQSELHRLGRYRYRTPAYKKMAAQARALERTIIHRCGGTCPYHQTTPTTKPAPARRGVEVYRA